MSKNKERASHYFMSDLHLGMHPVKESREREKRFVSWLDMIQKDAKALYLVGDIFDYWWEFGKVVPKGFVRSLGKLAELSDQGVELHFFTGNHDSWTFGYLEKELGMTVHKKPLIMEIQGKTCYIAHGDGLGKGDLAYKLLKSCFHNPLLQRLYALIHPDITLGIAHAWAKKSSQEKKQEAVFWGEDKELLFQHAKSLLLQQNIHYFVFGHRHIPLTAPISSSPGHKSAIIYLGDWIRNFTYAVCQNGEMTLKTFTPPS